MSKKNQNNQEELCSARLKQVLAELSEQGITQRHAAFDLNVPPQYLSDVKNGHRTLTEQFARRIAERYGVNFVWLVSGQGPKSIPRFDAGETPNTDTAMLPVLSEPIEGNPTESATWDGSKLKVSGAAAAMSARASQPYILRFTGEDRDGRLRKHDLVLVSQESTEAATIAVVQNRGRIVLARRQGKGEWKAIDTDRRLSAKVSIVGRCLGIVWATL